MPYKHNPWLRERINNKGITDGLPLFEQNKTPTNKIPHWIWDGSRIKAEVYDKLKNSDKWVKDQLQVLCCMIELGGSATDNEIKEASGLEINIVTGRRNDLVKMGYVTSYPDHSKKDKDGKPGVKKKLGPKGVANTLWFVDFKKIYSTIF